jgi:acid phosphatase
MNNTLIVLTFDEIETYTQQNKVFTILLGGAIPASLHGTTDSTFYNHYSMLSTVEVNWGLPSLGRWDCNANVLALVANKTGYTNTVVNTANLFFNTSYPGPDSNKAYIPTWPSPDTNARCIAGSILGSVTTAWGKSDGTFNYTNVYPYDAGSSNNVGGSATTASGTASKTVSGSASGTASSTSSSTSKSGASSFSITSTAIVGIVAICACILAL